METLEARGRSPDAARARRRLRGPHPRCGLTAPSVTPDLAIRCRAVSPMPTAYPSATLALTKLQSEG